MPGGGMAGLDRSSPLGPRWPPLTTFQLPADEAEEQHGGDNDGGDDEWT